MATNEGNFNGIQGHINALLLDGGGIRGLASLLIIQRLMLAINNLRPHKQSSEELQPRDVFDFVAGTSTGGLIAIMLGKLGLSIEECIEEYEDLSGVIFGKKRWGGRLTGGLMQARYDGKTLNRLVVELMERKHLDPTKTMVRADADPEDTIACAVVCNEHKGPSKFSGLKKDPVRFCNAACHEQAEIPCLIPDAAQATTAAMTYFSLVRIGDRWFSDGGVRYNNPSFAILEHYTRDEKAKDTMRKFRRTPPPENAAIRHDGLCFTKVRMVNIGTGHIDDDTPEKKRHKVKYALTPRIVRSGMELKATLVDSATASQHNADFMRLVARRDEKLTFERLSPTNEVCWVKLDKHKKISQIREFTNKWLEKGTIKRPDGAIVSVDSEITRIASEIVGERFLTTDIAAQTISVN